MGIDQSNVVDAIGVEPSTGKVILTISDHLDWSDQELHEFKLQAKLNSYLAFIEGGELVEQYPGAKGRVPVIDIVARVPPSPAGVEFLRKVTEIVQAVGIEMRSRVLK